MRIWGTLAAGIGLAATMAGTAAAAQLEKTTVGRDGPRVTLQLRFDQAIDYHPVYNYAKNLLVVQVKGLKLSRQQLRNGPAVHSPELADIVKSGSFEQGKETGDLRLQLAEGITPGDALLIEREHGLDIQFVLPEGSAARHTPAAGTKPAKPGNAAKPQPAAPQKPDSGDAAPLVPPYAPPVASSGSAGGDQSPSDAGSMTGLNGQTYSEPPLTVAGGNADSAAIDDPAEPDPAPAETNAGGGDPGFIPDKPDPGSGDPAYDAAHNLNTASHFKPGPKAHEPVATAHEPLKSSPSYKKFDLSQVPVKQLEIKGVAFREALSQLVAGCGFNVIVGDGIDNEPVYLNFTQKQLSLKSALETLCMAYELQYSVQDDAIVITRQ